MNTPPVRLTERQRTICEMVANGYGIRQIASELGESEDDILWAWDATTDALAAETDCHAIALAIRGGHIL